MQKWISKVVAAGLIAGLTSLPVLAQANHRMIHKGMMHHKKHRKHRKHHMRMKMHHNMRGGTMMSHGKMGMMKSGGKMQGMSHGNKSKM